MHVLLWIIAGVSGVASVVGLVWWAVDAARWIRARRAGRAARLPEGSTPPADPTPSGRWSPRGGGER